MTFFKCENKAREINRRVGYQRFVITFWGRGCYRIDDNLEGVEYEFTRLTELNKKLNEVLRELDERPINGRA